jgi:hypothetical protein
MSLKMAALSFARPPAQLLSIKSILSYVQLSGLAPASDEPSWRDNQRAFCLRGLDVALHITDRRRTWRITLVNRLGKAKG